MICRLRRVLSYVYNIFYSDSIILQLNDNIRLSAHSVRLYSERVCVHTNEFVRDGTRGTRVG